MDEQRTRKSRLTADQRAEIKNQILAGEQFIEIARACPCSTGTVQAMARQLETQGYRLPQRLGSRGGHSADDGADREMRVVAGGGWWVIEMASNNVQDLAFDVTKQSDALRIASNDPRKLADFLLRAAMLAERAANHSTK